MTNTESLIWGGELQARLIDDVTGTLPPYDQFITLGPVSDRVLPYFSPTIHSSYVYHKVQILTGTYDVAQIRVQETVDALKAKTGASSLFSLS